MSYKNSYDPGLWEAICDVCGRKFKASSLQKRWDGLMVCPGDYETRQPQDFVRGVADTQVPPWTRPEAQDTFIFFCTLVTIQGQADIGVADCARAGSWSGVVGACTIEGKTAIPGVNWAVAGCCISGNV